MYLLYLDDSGSTGNKDESHLVVGGFCVFERQVHWLTKELDELASKLWPADPHAVEFHASAMFGRKGLPWSSMPDRDQRRSAIQSVLGVFKRAHESTRAFACVVHKASFPDRDPMEVAFEELCSRFDLFLMRRHYAGDTQRGLIILDKSSYETSLQRLARDFRSLGTRWGVLRNLADIPLFVDSHACRAVQMADHIAYSVFRRYEAGDTSYLDLILPKFDAVEGKLHGLVHKQTVKSDCMCPACMSRR